MALHAPAGQRMRPPHSAPCPSSCRSKGVYFSVCFVGGGYGYDINSEEQRNWTGVVPTQRMNIYYARITLKQAFQQNWRRVLKPPITQIWPNNMLGENNYWKGMKKGGKCIFFPHLVKSMNIFYPINLNIHNRKKGWKCSTCDTHPLIIINFTGGKNKNINQEGGGGKKMNFKFNIYPCVGPVTWRGGPVKWPYRNYLVSEVPWEIIWFLRSLDVAIQKLSGVWGPVIFRHIMRPQRG